MRAFRSLTARAAVLDRPDVDTDQIIPKQFLKRIERTGYGEFLFFDWRQDPDFELNRPGCDGARILVAGPNFACGSSREHAAWALQDYGFDVVIAPSVAAANRPEDPASEIRLLLVHGILHLLGHDHMRDDDRAEMWTRQERYSGVRTP